jgi:hypothetical protein
MAEKRFEKSCEGMPMESDLKKNISRKKTILEEPQPPIIPQTSNSASDTNSIRKKLYLIFRVAIVVGLAWSLWLILTTNH